MSSFWTYITGFVVLIIGLNLAALQLGVEPPWMITGSLVLLGIGIMFAVNSTKTKDPPAN
jgi:hypothetical protein